MSAKEKAERWEGGRDGRRRNEPDLRNKDREGDGEGEEKRREGEANKASVKGDK